MAEKIRYEVDVDSSDAKRGLQEFSRAAKKAGKDAADALDDTATAGDKARAAIKKMADSMDTELRAAAKAADALGQALGPELAGRTDLDQVVGGLKRMGVSFEEITADADKFAATLREVDGVRLQQANDGLNTARAGTDKLSDSARGANSALANMIGNSAQDLGALGGVAGSAGVAIGQIAEYAADASLGGEALGASLKSMAAVAGPIAALSAAMLALQGIMKLIHRDDGLTAAQVAAVTEALAEQIGILDDYQSAVASAFGQGTADTIDVFTEAIMASIEATNGDEFITGLETALGRLGVVRREFGEIAAQSQQDQAAWFASLLNLHGVVPALAAEVADYYAGLSTGSDATAEWARANPELAASLLKVSDALGEARRNNNAATQDFLDREAGINAASRELVNTAIAIAAAQAEATGAQFTWNDALQAYITLQQQLLQLGGGVVAVTEAQTAAQEDQAAALAEGIQAWKDHATAVQEAAIAVGDILEQVPDIAGGLEEQLGGIEGVFAGLKFDVDFEGAIGDAIDELDHFKPDLQTLADDWADILEGEPVDIFGNVRADDAEFLEKIGNLRNLINDGVVNAFQQGGEDAADTFIQANAARIAESTGLDISEVYRIMGLPPDGSIETIIEPIVDAAHADQARGILDALAGVEGGEVREARIHVALETGQIDGDVALIAAQLLAHDALHVPIDLSDFTPEQIAEAQRWLDGQTLTATIGAEVDGDDAVNELEGITAGWWGGLWPRSGRVATIRTEVPTAAATGRILDGVAMPGGRPRVAQITLDTNPDVFDLNHAIDFATRPRRTVITLETHSTLIPPSGGGGGTAGGQSVTTLNAAPTATATASAAPMLSASPTVFHAATPAGNVVTNNVTINTGVLGNHFDVERTVNRALRRHQRVNGRR